MKKSLIYYVYYHSTTLESENPKLLDVIKSFPAWAILGPSFFLVQYDPSMKEEDAGDNLDAIRGKVDAVCGPKDYYFIGRMGDIATWKGYGTNLKAWLMNNAIPKLTENEDVFALNEPAIPAGEGHPRRIRTAPGVAKPDADESKNIKKN